MDATANIVAPVGLGATADIMPPQQEHTVETPSGAKTPSERPSQDGILGLQVKPQESAISEITVSPQKKPEYVLVPAFETSGDSDGTKKKWPWFHSCVWFATANPDIEKRYLLLKKAIYSAESNNGNISDDIISELNRFDPTKYSDSTRITKESLIAELEEFDKNIRNSGIPCAKVIRFDSQGNRTNSIKKTKKIAVLTIKLNSDHTFRVEMGQGQYVDLHFDGQGNYAGCAFLCGSDNTAHTKFPDNYMSEGFNKGLLKGTIEGLSGGFTVNGTNICSKILESLEAAKTPEQMSKEKTSEQQRTDEDISPVPASTEKSHARSISSTKPHASTRTSVDFACGA